MVDAKNPSKTSSKATANDGDAGEAEMQRLVDQEQEQGYLGYVPDPTPNENYTLQGVGKKLPTPETDPEQARKAGSTRFRGSDAEAQR